ncbi:hypothetical protein GGI43DRAFT_433387 [Trichoderma evansii]
MFDNVPKDAHLSEFILAATEGKFVCVSLYVNTEYITIVYPPSFWDRLVTFPESLRHVAEEVRTEFDQTLHQGTSTFLTFTFPHSKGCTDRWDCFSPSEMKQNPFGNLTNNCRGGNVDDLDYNNVCLGARKGHREVYF